jgi:hypothetical protein
MNEGTENVTGAGVMNGIEVASHVAVVGGAAMYDEVRMKSCLGLLRLTTLPRKGTKKLSGAPASLLFSCRNMVTYFTL